MNFLNLTRRNRGVFRGQQHFDFIPVHPSQTATSPARHLTIISGHNGSGKSTLFQAVALALYGPRALGERVSRQTYSDVLLSRFHRYSDADVPILCDEGDVALNLRYIQSGRPRQIRIKRHWQRRGRNVMATLAVFQAGQPPEVDAADYQSWINDLMPSGLASVCFFDAERLEAFGSPESHDAILGETLRRLFGLDIIERLQGDLDHHMLHRGGGRRADRVRAEVLQCQAALEALEAQCHQRQSEAHTLAATQAKREAELAEQARRLVAEGGSYAARCPIVQERLGVLQGEIEGAANDMRALCADLLPFALVPALCHDVSQRLIRESEGQRYRVAGELWRQRVASVRASLQGRPLWQGLDVAT
jgi:DNA sulfur modification protein DndD